MDGNAIDHVEFYDKESCMHAAAMFKDKGRWGTFPNAFCVENKYS